MGVRLGWGVFIEYLARKSKDAELQESSSDIVSHIQRITEANKALNESRKLLGLVKVMDGRVEEVYQSILQKTTSSSR